MIKKDVKIVTGKYLKFFFYYLCIPCSFSVAQGCPTLCEPRNCHMPGFLVLHHLLEFALTHVDWVNDTIQPSHPLFPLSPPAFNLSKHQGLLQWVSTSHQVAKILGLEPLFSLSSFTFIKRVFSSCSFSAIRKISSAYLRLLIFLSTIFISACASSNPVFSMMHFAYKVKKQGNNIQPWRTPFPILNQPDIPSLVLTVAFWPA